MGIEARLNQKWSGMTKQERSARAAEEGELFRLLVENVKDYAIIVLDSHAAVRSWNPGAERLLGYSEEEIVGKPIHLFFTPEDVENGIPEFEIKKARASGRGEDDRWHVRKDGSRFWCSGTMTPLLDEENCLRGFAKIMRDCTDMRLAEAKFARLTQESEQQRRIYETALSNTADFNYVFDLQGRFVYVNKSLLALWRKEWSEAVGKNFFELDYPPDLAQRLQNQIQQVIDTKQPITDETSYRSAEGERQYEYIFMPVTGADGTVEAVTGSTRDITERKKAEESLRSAERWWRGLAEALPNLVWTDLPDGQCDYLSSQWETYTGIPVNELLGLQWLHRVVHPDDRERTMKSWMTAVEDKGIYDVEYRIRRHDGRYHWFKTRGVTIRDEHGRIVKWFGTCTDIEDQKQAVEELRRSEERFRQLADAMPQIVWTARPDGIIDYQNRQWQEFTGLSETRGNEGWDKIVHPDDSAPSRELWAASVAGGTPFEMEIRLFDRRSQSYRWHLIRTLPARDELGKVVRWYGTGTDIDGQKRAGQGARFLAEVSAALATLVDYESTLQKVANLAVPYFADWSAVDLAGEGGALRRLVVAHRDPEKVRLAQELARRFPISLGDLGAVAAVFRYGRPEVAEEVNDELLKRTARDEEHLRLLRELGLRSYLCVPLVVSGKTMGVLTFATAESGRCYDRSDLALAEDLSHRAAIAIENAQLYRELQEADRRKDEFLATLAHELRNPLAPIRNSLQILKMSKLDPVTIDRSREMMERQVHHLVRLVDDLLDVSRVMRGKIELRRERVDIATIVARAVEIAQPLIEAQGHELIVSLPPAAVALHADPVRLAQVAGNLLTNAAKYTEGKGQIWLTAQQNGGEAVLSVRDTGIGISPEMLPRIFDLFVQVDHAATRSQGGLGIGLTLVKNLVELHRGTVEARSDGLGRGSEFIVRLPLFATGTTSSKEREESGRVEQHGPSGLKLLLVDDNRDAAESLALLLRMKGHVVRVAHDGLTALEIVKNYLPDMVFLDIGMPGMDGYEVARRLRRQPGLEKVRLAAITGWGQQEDRRRSAEAGFSDHLIKPVEPSAVERLIAELRADQTKKMST